jgi:uncharacterized membrane protein
MEYASLVLVHVFSAIIWAGGAVAVGLFIIPSVMEAGPAGGSVMAGVMKRRFPVLMTVAGFLVLLSGIRLFTLQPLGATWFTSPHGIVLTLGALLGIAALGFGFFLQRPIAMRLGALAGQIAAAGKPPTPEQAAEMKALQTRLVKVARLTAWHLIAAALLMSSHRLAAMM